jgi:hypothetical protein
MRKYVVYGHYVTGYAVEVEANSKEEALEKGVELLADGKHDTMSDGNWRGDFEARVA